MQPVVQPAVQPVASCIRGFIIHAPKISPAVANEIRQRQPNRPPRCLIVRHKSKALLYLPASLPSALQCHILSTNWFCWHCSVVLQQQCNNATYIILISTTTTTTTTTTCAKSASEVEPSVLDKTGTYTFQPSLHYLTVRLVQHCSAMSVTATADLTALMILLPVCVWLRKTMRRHDFSVGMQLRKWPVICW